MEQSKIKELFESKLPCGRCDNLSGTAKIDNDNGSITIRFICDNCGKVLYEEKVLQKISIG